MKTSPNQPPVRRPRGAFLVLLYCVLAASLAVYLQNRLPEASGEDAPPSEFSASRAVKHLQFIAAAPHPIGSQEHAAVRQYVLDELTKLGIESEVQETTAVSQRRAGALNAGAVRNVLGRIRGTEQGRAVLLTAHYDSVPTGPGASDDGAGVATLLETARALKTGGTLKNDVILLFTDGEELGLLGANAFVGEHPRAKDVGLVLNFEARGNGGPSMMFETSAGNGNLIREFAASAPHPVANSFFYELYRLLPNDTDFSILKTLDAGGMNFAYIDGINHYHTSLDTPGNVDRGSVQQQGSNALALARRFGNAPVNHEKVANAVYFNAPGGALVSYGGAWTIPLLVLAAMLFVYLFVRGVRSKELDVVGVLFGFLGVLAAVILSGIVVSAAWWFIRLVRSSYKTVPWGEPYQINNLRVAFVLLVVAIVSALYLLLRRKVSAGNLVCGGLLWWLIIAALVSATLPGGSYLFTLPLLFILAGTLLISALKLGDSWKSQAIFAVTVTPGVLLMPPMIYNIFVGLTLNDAGVVAVFVVLLCALLLPSLLAAMDSLGWTLPGLLALAALCFIGAGVMAAGFDRERPQINSAFYALNSDTGAAVWASSDERPDSWSEQFFQKGTARQSMSDYFPGSPRAYLKSPAPSLPLAPPVAELTGDQTAGDMRTISFHVTSARRAPVLSVYTEPGVEVLDATVNGKPAGAGRGSTATTRNWVLNFYGLPETGADVTLKTRGTARLKVLLIDRSYGLPETPIKPRPESMMPAPTMYNDTTLVSKRFEF